jgi:hypothetical protein
MAEHNVTLELYWDATWHLVPALIGTASYSRGTNTPDGDNDPAQGKAVIDNSGNQYAPRNVLSGLYGKIGQNTPARMSADASVRATLEVALWNPDRPIKGSSRTTVELAGILRRIGIGTDPIRSALTRAAYATKADGLVAYWSCEEGSAALAASNLVAGGALLTPGNTALVQFGKLDSALVPAGLERMPAISSTYLSAAITATSTVSWRFEAMVAVDTTAATGFTVRAVRWETGGGIQQWQLAFNDDGIGGRNAELIGTSPFLAGTPFGNILLSTGSGDPDPFDGKVHHYVLDVNQTDSTHMAYLGYVDGVLQTSGSNTTGALIGQQQVGAPRTVYVNPDSSALVLTVAGVGVWSPKPVTPIDYQAVLGYPGETTAARFQRFCDQEGITATITGTAANTVLMGPQTTDPLLAQFDLMAATDDASIFETRGAGGLTLRTGGSKLNQTAALSVSYLGQVQPPLRPVVGDTGIRNDVTAKNPDGSSARVTQDTGPRNTQSPLVDAQGVGRYTGTPDVNVYDPQALADVAGWRVGRGTYDGTWYASVTIDLDAAPGLATTVNAVDIGDLLRLRDLPAEDTISDFYGIVVGITESLPPKRRLVTFFLVPGDPYRVGVLSDVSADTAVLVGHVESDGATLAATVAAGVTTFTVTIASGPLWTTVADDFPQDVVVGAQRVTVSSVSGAASPQTFTVSAPLVYGVAAGAVVSEYQPIIPTLVD